MLKGSRRPLFWLGNGIRLSGAVDLIEPFLERFNVPFITSWQGKDMVRHDHPRFCGHAGIYGHRAANHIVQQADLIIAIGTRLALPQTGYDLSRFAPVARVIVVDLDENELEKFPRGTAINADAGYFMRSMMGKDEAFNAPVSWLIACDSIQDEMPWLEPMHQDTDFINSYRFMWELNKWLRPDQIITTDMGTALLCAYPMLKLNGKQRLITSTGLGEMGFGLPASIGAQLSNMDAPLLCLNSDGGMMFNLQELATIQHQKLPIKIMVFSNQGYTMIKRSQDGLGMGHTGSGASDLSFPNWQSIALSFGFYFDRIKTWEDFNISIPSMFGSYMKDKKMLIEVMIDPEQKFGPKVPTLKDENGKVYSPSLEHMQ